MSRRSLADLKKFHEEQEEKKSSRDNKKQKNDFNIYAFWQMEVGQHARVRLIEDKNQDNPLIFHLEKFNHKLSIGSKNRNIPCLAQYGEKCPICELSRAYYKQEGNDSKNGKYYYRKKSAIVRLLVLEDPLPPDKETGETYKGKVVTTYLGHQLLNKMMAQMTDKIEPMDNDPWDLDAGNDFIIEKSNDGKWDVYDLKSRFVSKISPIAEEYRSQIELVDLETLRAPNPGLEKVEKLLSAHQTGEDLDDHDVPEEPDQDSDKGSRSPKSKVVEKAAEEPEKDEKVEDAVPADVPASSGASRIMDRFKKNKAS